MLRAENIFTVIQVLLLTTIATTQAETNGTCGFFGTTEENEILFLVLLALVAVLILAQAIAFAVIAVKVLRALRRFKYVDYTGPSQSPKPASTHYSQAYPAERGVEMTETRRRDSKPENNANRSSPGVYEELNTAGRDPPTATYDNPTDTAADAGTTFEPPRRKISRFSKMPDSKRNGETPSTVYENSAHWGRY